MAGGFAPNPLFDQPDGAEVSAEASSPIAVSTSERAVSASKRKVMAMGGLALFALALFVAFRVVALDAARQLRQPAVDFAFCGAIALLGLSMSWVYLGDNPPLAIEDIADQDTEIAFEELPPSPPLPSSPQSFPSSASFPSPAVNEPASLAPVRQRSRPKVCPYCSQKMAGLGPARWRCQICGHLEDYTPVSFLEAASSCDCHHCRESRQHAV
ncbi:MAG: hypothetical protein ACM3PW_12995 [Chlamydiota bacterium]